MPNENGAWIMRGLDWDNPYRIRTPQELINYIDQVGFLPLFANEIPGFSVEEHVSPLFWWSGDPSQDPWIWREMLAKSGKVVYGKFFRKKAGFISLGWLGRFANFRRDGYDFDSLWDDELASYRSKCIMDLFMDHEIKDYYSSEVKKLAGFGKNGHKGFEGEITRLQMQTYLVVKEFKQKVSKKGKAYGMPVSIYATPESIWGREIITNGYQENPEDSKKYIIEKILEEFPDADLKTIDKMIR